jgi:hypothetical protein
VERRELGVVRAVKESIHIPVAAMLSPFYSSIANFALRLDEAGVDGLALFNRFYQPDIDVEQHELFRVNLSSAAELLLRLLWIGVLSGQLRSSLAAIVGIHTAMDAVKAVMVGTHATQKVSAPPGLSPTPGPRPPRTGGMAGAARVRVATANAREHESVAVRRPGVLPAGQLRAPVAKLARGIEEPLAA